MASKLALIGDAHRCGDVSEPPGWVGGDAFDGRRNRYEVHGELPLRHPRHRHRTVGDLIRFLETAD